MAIGRGVATAKTERNPTQCQQHSAYQQKNKMKNEKKNLTEQEREAYALVGRHGGRANFKKRGLEHMSKIGKKGARKRWGSKNNKIK